MSSSKRDSGAPARQLTLEQVLEAADRASEQMKSWPEWKRNLSKEENETMSDLKRDIEDVRWALKAFEPEERKRNADMMRYTCGLGRPVNTQSSFERIVEALESRTNSCP